MIQLHRIEDEGMKISTYKNLRRSNNRKIEVSKLGQLEILFYFSYLRMTGMDGMWSSD